MATGNVTDREFLGAPDVPATWEQAQVKGHLIGARRRYILKVGGEAALTSISERTQGEARRWLQAPPPTNVWCPYRDLVPIDRGIVDVMMGGDVEKVQEFGAEIATYDLNSVYRALLRLAGPTWVMRTLPLTWNLYFREGKLSVEPLPDETGVRASLHGLQLPRYMCRFGVVGWLNVALEAARVGNSHVEHRCRHEGAEACTWNIRWG